MKHKLVNLLVFLMLLLTTNSSSALGRLFMTLEQRIQLDHNTVESKADEQQNTESQYIYLNGFVKPKHAKSTIWVNGVEQKGAQRKYHVRHWISPKNHVSVDLQGDRAELSPGQTLDIDNRIVIDIYALKNKEKQAEDERKESETEGLEKTLLGSSSSQSMRMK